MRYYHSHSSMSNPWSVGDLRWILLFKDISSGCGLDHNKSCVASGRKWTIDGQSIFIAGPKVQHNNKKLIKLPSQKRVKIISIKNLILVYKNIIHKIIKYILLLLCHSQYIHISLYQLRTLGVFYCGISFSCSLWSQEILSWPKWQAKYKLPAKMARERV